MYLTCSPVLIYVTNGPVLIYLTSGLIVMLYFISGPVMLYLTSCPVIMLWSGFHTGFLAGGGGGEMLCEFSHTHFLQPTLL